MNFEKSVDEFRQQYEDKITTRKGLPERHYCPMYEDHIPDEIYHKGAECEWYVENGRKS